MTHAYDPELAAQAAARTGGSIADAPAARKRFLAAMAKLPPYAPPVALRIEGRSIPGPDGAPDVPVRIYAPKDHTEPLPGLVYFHGGGFTVNAINDSEIDSQRMAAEANAVVVSVDYRLAPEHRFPAAFDDCYAALEWTAKNTAELGIDPTRIAVGGESAGGGLAAAVALRARDEHGPALHFLYLMIPELDDRLETPSAKAYDDTPSWSRSIATQSWTHYLGPGVPGTADVPDYAAPARAEDLSNLPPTYISAMQFDPLRDEQMIFAQRLLQAEVATELHTYPGTFHGSYLIPAAVSTRTIADAVAALRRGLAVRA